MAVTRETAAPGLLASIRRYRWSSLAIVLGFVVLSAVAGLLMAPSPSATATLALKNPGPDNVLAQGVVGDAALTRYTKQRGQFITSDEVLRAVSAAVPGYSLTQLRSAIDVESSAASNVLTVKAEARSAEDAVTLANTVLDSYRQATAAQVKQQTAAALASIETARRELLQPSNGSRPSPSASTTVADLDRQASSLQTDSATFLDGIDFVQEATLADAVAPGLPYRYIASGLLFGLVVAALVAWVRADRSPRVTDPEAAEVLLDAPLLGSVAVGRRQEGKAVAGEPRQYSLVAASLGRRSRHGLVALLAAGDAASRAEVTYNLALSLAADGARVLVVDADPAGPVTAWLRNGGPGWLTPPADAALEDAEAARRALARHAALRGATPPVTRPTLGAEAPPAPVGPPVADVVPARNGGRERPAEEPAFPVTAPMGVAAGLGLTARAARENPAVKPISLPLPFDPAGRTGQNGAPQNGAAQNGPGSNGAGSNGAAPNGTGPDAVGEDGPQPDAAHETAHVGERAHEPAAPFDPLALASRVTPRDDATVQLITVSEWAGRDSAASRRELVEGLVRIANRVDVVLLDLPAPEASPLVPALLRVSTESLVVVSQDAGEDEVDRVRRAAALVSMPVTGFVFAHPAAKKATK